MMLKKVLEGADYKDILTALIDEGIISKGDVAAYYSGEIAPFLRGAKYSKSYVCSYSKSYVCSDGHYNGLKEFDTRDLTESGEAIIDDRITEIGDEAFANCSQVTKIVLPKNVKSIGRLAFFNCPNLETVVLPKDLKVIEYGAFWSCPKLTNINIPMLNVRMSENVFSNTPAGEKFMQQLEERRLQLNKWSGVDKPMYSYIIDRKLVQFDERDLNENGEFVVPAPVIRIEDVAFQDCGKLIRIKFLPGLQEIGYAAFRGCYKLKEVKMSNTITEIEEHAFDRCFALKEIVLPTSLERIEPWTFNCCRLKKVVLPEGLKSIQAYAFCDCKDLEDINVPDSLSYVEDTAFYGSGVRNSYRKLIEDKGKRIETRSGGYSIR